MKDVFTTTQVAKICRASRVTVNRWLNNGNLSGYKPTPNSNWRITKNELLRFMITNKIPVDLLKSNKTKVLIVDDDKDITYLVSKVLSEEENLEIEVAHTGFKAGIKLTEFKPDIVILDIILGDIDGRELLEHIKGNKDLGITKVIGISGNIEIEEKSLIDMGFDAFVRKPFHADEIKDEIFRLIK